MRLGTYVGVDTRVNRNKTYGLACSHKGIGRLRAYYLESKPPLLTVILSRLANFVDMLSRCEIGQPSPHVSKSALSLGPLESI